MSQKAKDFVYRASTFPSMGKSSLVFLWPIPPPLAAHVVLGLLLFSRSVMSDSLRLHGLQHARLPSLSFTISQSLLKLMSVELVMPSNHLILCHPLFLLPSIFPNIRVFSSESVLHIRWPEYWSFSFSISPSNEFSSVQFSCSVVSNSLRFHGLQHTRLP